VERARDRILANVVRAGVALERVRGLLVEEMVFGAELIVGLNRDPWYGPYIVLGRGGVNVEDQTGSALLKIAASCEQIEAALGKLGLIGGGAGDAAALRATAELVETIAREFVTGRLSAYATVELNPVILTIDGPKIADVLLVAGA